MKSKRRSDQRTHSSGGEDAQNRGESAASQLESNSLYKGIIKGVDPINRSYTVRIEDRDTVVDNCAWAAGIFSSMFGIQTTFLPTLGTGVVILYCDNPVIIGSYPTSPADLNGGAVQSITGTGVLKKDLKTYKHDSLTKGSRAMDGKATPGDMLEGEFDISHTTGCGIAFLTNLVKMSAGDRAKVETHLLNDMVRIVSETFKHHSSFGDFEIYNDGRLNCRINGTSYEHEAWGIMDEDSEKVPTENGAVKFDSIDKVNETGRWRFSEYVGFLGDFLHQIISDPTETIGQYAASAARAGKSRMQFLNDGSILMQALGDISIERVTRVVVPIEKKRPDDPTGNTFDGFEALEQKYLKIWDYGKDHNDMSKACYQLREYARYLSGFHAYARHMQMSDDWDVPAESASPTPEWSAKEKDREEAAGASALKHFDVYSAIRIMRDGSQVFMDGYGSAIVMSRGVVQISASKHIEMEAPGNINIRAGQDVTITGRRNIDIVAVAGGILMKSRTWFRTLCEKGSIWLKSDVDTKEGAPPYVPADEDAENPDQYPEAQVLSHGIVLDAPSSGILHEADHQVMVNITGSQGGDAAPDPLKGDFVVKTTGGLVFKSAKKVTFDAQDELRIKSKDFNVRTTNINFGTVQLHVVGADGSVNFKTGTGRTEVRRLLAENVTATKYLAGPEFKYLHVSSLGFQSESAGNMVHTAPDFLEVLVDPNIDSYLEWEAEDPLEVVSPPRDEGPWALREQADVRWDPNYEFFESIAQQTIRLLGDGSGHYLDADAYVPWSGTETALKAGMRTDAANLPFPGTGAKHFTHDGGEPLYKPSDTPYSGLSEKATTLNQKSVSWMYLKKQ